MTISPRCQRQRQRQRMKKTQQVLYFRKAEDATISNMTISPRCQRQRQRQRQTKDKDKNEKKTQHVLYFRKAEDARISNMTFSPRNFHENFQKFQEIFENPSRNLQEIFEKSRIKKSSFKKLSI